MRRETQARHRKQIACRDLPRTTLRHPLRPNKRGPIQLRTPIPLDRQTSCISTPIGESFPPRPLRQETRLAKSHRPQRVATTEAEAITKCGFDDSTYPRSCPSAATIGSPGRPSRMSARHTRRELENQMGVEAKVPSWQTRFDELYAFQQDQVLSSSKSDGGAKGVAIRRQCACFSK